MKIYGFVFMYPRPEGILRFIPKGCTDVLVYSDDALTFHEEAVGDHISQICDFKPGEIFECFGTAFEKVTTMGKYKLDLAIRIQFPRYAKAGFKE